MHNGYVVMHNTDGMFQYHNMLHRTIRPYPLAKLSPNLFGAFHCLSRA